MEQIFALDGKVYRQQPGRKTLRFELAGKGYFLKLHWPVSWREISKNLLYLRWPVLGAASEWRAIRHLETVGVPTMQAVAYGSAGFNPLRRHSFLITRELANMHSLEEVCADWQRRPPAWRLRIAIIRELANVARMMHGSGLNHRDFYLCHFLLPDSACESAGRGSPVQLFVIDLHRAQIRRKVPRRWLVKDLGALCFSALDIGLTRRDLLRFIKIYEDRPLAQVFRDRAGFYLDVRARAEALYLKAHGRLPQWP